MRRLVVLRPEPGASDTVRKARQRGLDAVAIPLFEVEPIAWEMPDIDQFAALLGTFSLPPSGYLALAVQAVVIAAITAWASRRTLFATLDDID